jgi:hypothetical protein
MSTDTTADQITAEDARGAADDAAPTQGDLKALVKVLEPVLVDVAVPLGTYFVLHAGFGVGLVPSLIASSVVPTIRTVDGLFRRQDLNALATLMLVVNIAGIALSFVTGNPRMMIAKDSVISSVIAIAMLASVAARRPLMSNALKPMLTKGDTAKVSAWDRLSATSAKFQRHERVFTTVWGLALLADCVARFVGAFALPVTTMVWLGTVFLLAAIALACVVGNVATGPMEKMITEESGAA